MTLLAVDQPVTLASGVPEGLGLFVPPWPEVILSLICLAIIALAVAKFGVPRYLKVLDERAAKIEGGLKRAEAAEAEIAQIRAGLDAEKEEARLEAARIREEAKSDAAAIVTEARARSKAEATSTMAAAARQIASERRSAEVSLRQDIGVVATQLAERIVGETLKDSTVAGRVVDRFLADLDAAQSATAAKE